MGATYSPKYMIYLVFKYTIYAWLTYNIFAFYMEESAAMLSTHPEGLSLGNFIEVFPATLDTLAWVILLLLFEWETFWASDETLKGSARYPLFLLKALCYGSIVFSWYGYIDSLLYYKDVVTITVANACDFVSQGYSVLTTVDEYEPLTAETCAVMSNTELYKLTNDTIIATPASYEEAVSLAWIDVINSSTWIIVVLALEADVYMQLKGTLTDMRMKVSYYFKGMLYLALLYCAVIWSLDSDFLDASDAFLWLLAFFMIEMNVFEWHEEVEAEKANQQ